MASTSPLVLSMAIRAPCAPESCFESGAARAAFHGRGKVDVDDVAGLDERIAVALAGPLPVLAAAGGPRSLVVRRPDAGVEFQAGRTLVTRAWT